RQRGFAETRWSIVGLDEFYFDGLRSLVHASRLVIIEILLNHSAFVDGDFPSHQVAHAFDHTALHEAFGLARIDDLAADIDRGPSLIDLDLLVGTDRDLYDICHISSVSKLECSSHARSLWKLVAVLPVGHISHRFQDATGAIRIESTWSCRLTDGTGEQVESI